MNQTPERACRLYLCTPPDLGSAAKVATFAERLAAALETGDIACVLLRTTELDGIAAARSAEALRALVQGRDVALLIEGHAELARDCGADGLHIAASEGLEVPALRRLIGPEAIVGVGCGVSRDPAVAAAETGADYVAFGDLDAAVPPPAELLSLWQETMTPPCVALGGITLANAAGLARAGADFLAVENAVWDHPEGPAAAVRAFNAVLSGTAP